jgi:uncharacterized membrane protein YqaE (UPF0057 family)
MNSINICFNKKNKTIYNPNISNLLELKQLIIKKFELKIAPSKCFLVNKHTKLLTDPNLNEELSKSDNKLELIVKLKGGIIDGILNMLMGIIKLVGSLFQILAFFITAFINVLEMLPLIFDPPRLIDDVLFAITSSIKIVFGRLGGDMKNMASSPEDDTKEQGPFGVSNTNRGAFTCMDPSWSTILLLIICPPLAIIYKLGFWQGFISSIICGVLCVKLYYFPGLLFAILHVLC